MYNNIEVDEWGLITLIDKMNESGKFYISISSVSMSKSTVLYARKHNLRRQSKKKKQGPSSSSAPQVNPSSTQAPHVDPSPSEVPPACYSPSQAPPTYSSPNEAPLLEWRMILQTRC
nr:hypothetical protein Iba_chr05aCG4620 [Ipomoea batatas]